MRLSCCAGISDLRRVEAPGRVELPTNGLGNRGFHPSLIWLMNLRVGVGKGRWTQSAQTAFIWQRIWQRFFGDLIRQFRDIVRDSARRFVQFAARLVLRDKPLRAFYPTTGNLVVAIDQNGDKTCRNLNYSQPPSIDNSQTSPSVNFLYPFALIAAQQVLIALIGCRLMHGASGH